MEEIELKIREIIEENKKMKEKLKEDEYIIKNCSYKIKDLTESNWNLSKMLKSAKNEVEFLKKRGVK